jgi:hypothetical protein
MPGNPEYHEKYDESTYTDSDNEASSIASPMISRDLHRNLMIKFKISDDSNNAKDSLSIDDDNHPREPQFEMAPNPLL